MRALTGELLLAAWEDGTLADEARRAVTMLSIALPGTDPGQLSALPLGERNRLLLRLHELSFGTFLHVFGTCPECSAQLEFAVPAAEMAAWLEGQFPASPVGWKEEGRHYRLRPVTTDDLLASLEAADMNAAQELLLSRCLQVAPAPESGQPWVPAVLRYFEQLNATAELCCAIECPGCSNREVLDLDIARFLWAEIRSAARRLLGDIHELASAYGWAERDILRMSAGRREAYLEMLSG